MRPTRRPPVPLPPVPLLLATLLLPAVGLSAPAAAPTGAAKPPPAAPAPGELSREVAARLIGGALSDGMAYGRLVELTDTIGPRLSGSPGYEAAMHWGLRHLKQDGLDARLEKVMVPHWVRGAERAEVVASASYPAHPLSLTALGGSVGTPDGGLTAEVVEVHSFDELHALGDKARGKIVFFNHTMGSKGGYGDFAALRVLGPSEAARAGGVAMLLRSLATASLRTPHTGMLRYEDGAPQLPSVAVATEDAELIHRLLARGPVRVHLELGCRTLPDVEAANVVADLRGREKPDEVVVIGAHLDSWDLATGATDDGAGVAIVMEAARQLAKLPTHPRRTVRVVLFANEENGARGGKGYAAAHAAELGRHVAALEADSGAGRPLALNVYAGEGGDTIARGWLAPLETLGISQLTTEKEMGVDISMMKDARVPMVTVKQDSSHYFDLHHSPADTLDKVNPLELAENAAAVAWITYALAESPQALPRAPAPEPTTTPGAPAPGQTAVKPASSRAAPK